MTAEIHQFETAPGPGRMATPQLRTLVVCDIADSTALVERMGDQNAANIIRKHDRLARALVEQHRGREIDKTDGFLLMFERPIQAAAFALDYQRGLKHMSAAEGVVVRARVGVHMGDVVIWENAPEDVARGAKPTEVEGLVKPVAARLAQLARPQQILMSSAAAGIAHRAEGELGAKAAERVHWKTHGRYRFKGLPEAIEVVEVGEDEVAPLHAPKSVRTAKRILPWWRRPLTLAAEAAMLLIAVGVTAWFLLQSPPTLAFAARDWVVVGDLHNLTGDTIFDQSVDSALRISLEQSQYVNVVPELSVQQTLQRMERDPAKTSVNRAIGSEVALRDGARALILPTLAEIGGRLRVTAEVIDPNTQATVYSVSSDGVGAQSVLSSLDGVSKQLRGKLGEALAMVSKQSQPLDKVATGNLVALRAYSLGEHATGTRHYQDAIRFYQQALILDPQFALAHVGLARIYLAGNDTAAAAQEIDAAWSQREHLGTRDQLYVDAWRATLVDSPNVALGKWETFSQMYPDDYSASALYAYFAWMLDNAFDKKTIEMAKKSLSPHNPRSGPAYVVLGMLYLGNERYADAEKAFEQARKEGLAQFVDYPLIDAVQRKFASAAAMFSRFDSSGVPGADQDVFIPRIAMAMDRGDFDGAQKILASTVRASNTPLLEQLQFRGIRLSLAHINGGSLKANELRDYANAIEQALRQASPSERSNLQVYALFVAYLAGRDKEIRIAQKLIDVANAAGKIERGSRVWKLASIARAERILAGGNASDAIKLIEPQHDGNEFYLSHVVLLDAYLAAKDFKSALAEAEWLAMHRGRAYSEWSAPIVIPFGVAQSDLAQLHIAELSVILGDHTNAHAALRRFLEAWPEVRKNPQVAGRVKKLQTAL